MKVKQQVLCAVFAAVIAICAQLIIPIQPVPISLANFGILLAGGFLGRKYGTISVLIYILLGSIGLPIFAMGKSGISVLVGPNGGFIIGYITTAFITGVVTEKYMDKKYIIFVGMFMSVLTCYLCGISWFIFLTQMEVWQAMTICVFPFILGDIVKVFAAGGLIIKYRYLITK